MGAGVHAMHSRFVGTLAPASNALYRLVGTNASVFSLEVLTRKRQLRVRLKDSAEAWVIVPSTLPEENIVPIDTPATIACNIGLVAGFLRVWIDRMQAWT